MDIIKPEGVIKAGSPLRRATSMVPNLFTVANMALGFFAIMASLDEQWIAASSAVFVAHSMDILDGRVARWMGLSSRFGAEFDSFADWISFGMAPGLMVYHLALRDFGKLGFLLCFLYILCGAIRLARFNVKAADGESSGVNFTGLPIPVAGGFLAVLVLLCGLFADGHQGRTMNLIYRQVPHLRGGFPIIVFGVSLLMISNVQYSTFKRMHFFRPQSSMTFLLTLFMLFMIYAYPQNTIFIMYAGYILWGFVKTGWRMYQWKRTSKLGPAI